MAAQAALKRLGEDKSLKRRSSHATQLIV